jgi:hypothetical protein
MNKSETVLMAIKKKKTKTLVTIGRYNAYGFVQNIFVEEVHRKRLEEE